jgi:hypothetical protein
MAPFPGSVLLLSPILGEFRDDSTSRGFIPPRAGLLMRRAKEGKFPTPKKCEIHVGSEDWQSHPDNVKAFGDATGIPVTVVPGGGHMLGKGYVGRILDRWVLG